MAVVRIPDENRVLRETADITRHLATIGIDYERWEPREVLPPGTSPEKILASYDEPMERLKQRGGYVTADVIEVDPATPNLEAMLAKFSCEHWHEEDEVRLILDGRGLFHINPRLGPLTAIEVEAGDLIRVPRGTWHWFDLCGERRIRAIRLFQDPAGWTPHYTDSGVDRNYQPVCMGSAYFPPSMPVNRK